MKNLKFKVYKTTRWFSAGVHNENLQGDGIFIVYFILLGIGFKIEYWYEFKKWIFKEFQFNIPNKSHVIRNNLIEVWTGTNRISFDYMTKPKLIKKIPYKSKT